MVRSQLLSVYQYLIRKYFAHQGAQCVRQVQVSSMSAGALDQVPEVDIDTDGRFKYILIQVYKKADEGLRKKIVRGYKWAAFHGDIYDDVCSKLLAIGFSSECIGGGRIIHESDKKTIQVFGYSQGFGKADHSITVDLLKKKYPEYTSISWSDQGY